MSLLIEQLVGPPQLNFAAELADLAPEKADEIFHDLARLYGAAETLLDTLADSACAQSHDEFKRLRTVQRLLPVLIDSAVLFGWLDEAEQLMIQHRMNEIDHILYACQLKLYPNRRCSELKIEKHLRH